LSFFRNEVGPKVTVGEQIYLLIENNGSNAFELSLHIDEEPTGIIVVEADGHELIHALVYRYAPEKHGKEQIITMGFLSPNGIRDVHRYTTKHGFRTLKRIDPA
jgi:hypothetical protein